MAESAAYTDPLTELQAAHGALLQAYRKDGATDEVLGRISALIQSGREMGASMDDSEQRSYAQSLLDYWVAVLYHEGKEPPDSTLSEYDESRVPPLSAEQCPYVGLNPFSEERARLFFGRDGLVAAAINKLTQGRLLVVFGASGSGKSSLVLAGIVPQLKSGAIPGSQEWRYLARSMVPGSDPLANLVRLLSDAWGERVVGDVRTWEKEQAGLLRENPAHLVELIDGAGSAPLLLVVDQFEELFTLCADEKARMSFAGALANLVQAPGPGHLVILTMREDFIREASGLPIPLKLFQDALLAVTAMSESELKEAIEKPAKRIGLRFESGLVDQLVRDVKGEEAALPLLQFTLLQLWNKRDRNLVTWEAYRRLGSCRLSLAKVADDLYGELSAEQKETLRRIFVLCLTRASEDRQDDGGTKFTRQRVPRDMLYRIGEPPDQVDAVLAKLVDAQLVRVTGDVSPDLQVEVAHEALLRSWAILRKWLDDERATIRRRQELTDYAVAWKSFDRDAGALLQGRVLDDALDGNDPDALAKKLDLDPLTMEFLRASLGLRRRAKVLRIAALGVVIAFLGLIFIGVSVLAMRADRMSRSRSLAWNAVYLLGTDPKSSAARAADAVGPPTAIDHAFTWVSAALQGNFHASFDQAMTEEAEDTLHRVFQASWLRDFSDHKDWVLDVAYSPDGKRVATASKDKTAKVWNPDTGTLLRTLGEPGGHTEAVTAVAFSPDGKRIATASKDKTAKVWSLDAEEPPRTFGGSEGHEDEATDVAFSPDGRRLATSSRDKTAKVWDLETGQVRCTCQWHDDDVTRVVYSPDGTLLATASLDRTAKVWDASNCGLLGTLEGHAGAVKGVAFRWDGRQIATASEDASVRLWEAISAAPGNLSAESLKGSYGLPRVLYGHAGAINDVVYDPTYGGRLITASTDGTARVWDLNYNKVLALSGPQGHNGAVVGVAYSPDGTRVLTAGGADSTAKLWRVTSGELRLVLPKSAGRSAVDSPNQSPVTEAAPGISRLAYSADGARLATASSDGRIRVWDSEDGRLLDTFQSTIQAGQVTAVALSPNGKLLASASVDGVARVWDIGSRTQTVSFAAHSDTALAGGVPEVRLSAIAFSPDGTQLATAGWDQIVQIRDVISWTQVVILTGHTDKVLDLAFDPRDGKRLATASADGTAKVWNTVTRTSVITLTLPGPRGGAVNRVVFSPDGRHIATAHVDGTVAIWDSGSPDKPLVLRGHAPRGVSTQVQGVAFSANGARLVAVSEDGEIRVWKRDTGSLLFSLSDLLGGANDIAYRPGGRDEVAVVGKDGFVYIYTLDVAQLVDWARPRSSGPPEK